MPHVPPMPLAVCGKRGRSFKPKPGGTQRMGIVSGSMGGRQRPSGMPRPGGDFVPSLQLNSESPRCPKAAQGGRRWCLIF